MSQPRQEFRLSENFSSSEAQQQPLVVLNGWINSKPKHIQKYADVYQGMGCATISAILPTFTGFSVVRYFRTAYTKRLLHFIEQVMAGDSVSETSGRYVPS